MEKGSKGIVQSLRSSGSRHLHWMVPKLHGITYKRERGKAVCIVREVGAHH